MLIRIAYIFFNNFGQKKLFLQRINIPFNLMLSYIASIFFNIIVKKKLHWGVL